MLAIVPKDMDPLLLNNNEIGYQKVAHQDLVDINSLKRPKFHQRDKKRKRMSHIFILQRKIKIISITKNNSTIKKYNHQDLVNIKF